MSEEKPPVVFISYCWKKIDPQHPQRGVDEVHKQRVKWLADKLIENGVDVLLDQYDLDRGDDSYHFMERLAHKDVNYVLMVCEPQYKAAFEARRGGVGTEAFMMTPPLFQELLEPTPKKKFIPLLFERESVAFESRPAPVAGKMYVDFTRGDEAGLLDLLKYIFDASRPKKPSLGKRPVFE